MTNLIIKALQIIAFLLEREAAKADKQARKLSQQADEAIRMSREGVQAAYDKRCAVIEAAYDNYEVEHDKITAKYTAIQDSISDKIDKEDSTRLQAHALLNNINPLLR